MKYSNSEKIEMLTCYIESKKNKRAAAMLYAQRFNERICPSPNTFLNVFNSISQHGRLKKKIIRKNTKSDESNALIILAYVIAHPHTSIRDIAEEFGYSFGNVHRILKKYKYHAYKPVVVQTLVPWDYVRRLDFISHMLIKLDDNPNFLSSILWTDEAKFSNNGVTNRHNSHLWNDTNPHWIIEGHNQVRWNINVWCGVIDDQIVGPYFFNENLTATKYLNFLKNELILLLENVPIEKRQYMFWQQDGAPAHNSTIVYNYLETVYKDRWMGTNSPGMKWPARSPDLSVLDFYLWGYIKNEVYKEKVNNLDELKIKIKNAQKYLKAF